MSPYDFNCWPRALIALLLLAAFSADVATAESDGDSDVTTVSEVDLERYTGLWHEIAKIPNRFQDQCAYGTTAEYTLREDGRIEVVNRCFEEDGELSEAKGEAKIVDPDSNAKLEVSFVSFLGWRPFWGDYWVIGLDEDYQWAVVGVPDRDYGWVLARMPELDEATLATIRGILERNGYQWSDFETSPATAP